MLHESLDCAPIGRPVDSGHYVRYIDLATAQDAIKAYKQQAISRMGLVPGLRVLDAGCGTGDDARYIAQMVGPWGNVTGIDRDTTMVEEARRRMEGEDLPVSFELGDVEQLPYADRAFDACRADRVIHVLEQPELAIEELARVTRPGGRVVLSEPDFATLEIAGGDDEVALTIAGMIAGKQRGRRMGHWLIELCQGAGLGDIQVCSVEGVLADYFVAEQLLHFSTMLKVAALFGLIDPVDGDAWQRRQQAASVQGTFGCRMAGVIVCATRA